MVVGYSNGVAEANDLYRPTLSYWCDGSTSRSYAHIEVSATAHKWVASGGCGPGKGAWLAMETKIYKTYSVRLQ